MARIPKRFQDDAWKNFTEWCQARGLQAVPTHHWTLAVYARTLASNYKADDIRKIVHAIAKTHSEKSRRRPDRHPLIERTLKAISTHEKTKEHHSKLFDEELVKENTRKKPAKPKVAPGGKTAPPTKNGRIMSAEPKLVSRRRLSK